MKWKQISRSVRYETPFMTLYEDVVELPSGHIIDDFSVVSFKDGVVIVATDENQKLIAIDEYKYAVGEVLRVLPAGGMEKGQSPEETALRELREETGYVGDVAEIIEVYYEYPSKLPHKTYVARIKNARKLESGEHEATETISEPVLLDFAKESIRRFHTSVNVAALYRALD